MKSGRCPYHVRQGIVDENGKLSLSDVCGVKTACGATCQVAPFDTNTFKECQRYIAHQRGAERQVLVPKNDIEYLPELGGFTGFSEMELM